MKPIDPASLDEAIAALKATDYGAGMVCADDAFAIISHLRKRLEKSQLLAYGRQHPPEAPKVCEPTPNVCDEGPKVRTVADALREMPVGTRFTRPVYKSTSPWVKIGEDVFSDGVVTMTGRRFMYQSCPADNPDHGIVILPAAEPVEQPSGVVVTLPIDLAKRLRDAAYDAFERLDGAAKAVAEDVVTLDHAIELAADARRKAEPK